MSVLIGLVIGLVLGLTGAGGSIFAVPLLMLLLGLPINDAIGIALGAVAVSALIGTLSNWRAQYILWIPAISLGLGGALVAPIGKQLGAQLPPVVLLVGFSALACIIALIGCGLVVGLLSGLFGVGGGFLIVPALLFISQVSMRQAVATSLLIICVIGGAGFASFAAGNNSLDWTLLAQVCFGGLLGMLSGRLVANRIAGPQLQKLFALALIAIAGITLVNKLINGVV